MATSSSLPSPPSSSLPPLRLVGTSAPPTPTIWQPVGQPITHAGDPRWVLALRTAEALQGTVMPPEQRQRLIRLGRVMGMTPFDANLVIAIVQDQARRGYEASYCPIAGEGQLAMVPLPRRTPLSDQLPGRRPLMMAIAIAAILLTEILLLRWWLAG